MPVDPQPFWLSLQLALSTTVLLFMIGVPLAYFIAFTSFRFKTIIEAIVSLPIVLPPSVVGFYMLLTLSPTSLVGGWLNNWFGVRLLFSFGGLVIASVIYSLPFMVQPIQAGLQSLPLTLRQASYTMGKSKWQTLLYVLLPNIKPALLSGIILSFAHTIGEFGLVLMIGGNLEGKTRTASIAVYDEVEALNFATAHIYSFILLLISFSILLVVYTINKKLRGRLAGL